MSEILKYMFKNFRFGPTQPWCGDPNSSQSFLEVGPNSSQSILEDEPNSTTSASEDGSNLTSTSEWDTTLNSTNFSLDDTTKFYSALEDFTSTRLSTFSRTSSMTSTPLPEIKQYTTRIDVKLFNVGQCGHAKESILRRISSRRMSSRSSLSRRSSFGMEGRPLNKIIATPPAISRQQRFGRKERRCPPPSQIPRPTAPRRIQDIQESLGDTVLVVESKPPTSVAAELKLGKSRIPKLPSCNIGGSIAGSSSNLPDLDKTMTIEFNPTPPPPLRSRPPGFSRPYSPWAVVSVRPFRMVRKSTMIRRSQVAIRNSPI